MAETLLSMAERMKVTPTFGSYLNKCLGEVFDVMKIRDYLAGFLALRVMILSLPEKQKNQLIPQVKWIHARLGLLPHFYKFNPNAYYKRHKIAQATQNVLSAVLQLWAETCQVLHESGLLIEKRTWERGKSLTKPGE